jgi:GNAT superfamily N-acetyltransferase
MPLDREASINVITSPDEVLPFLETVQVLADANKPTFGFLPASAYNELALQGRLWIAVDSRCGALLGYLLFGGRFPNLRVFQLFVDDTARGRGVGHLLVASLRQFAESHAYQTITARVAADLAANRFWEKENFRVIRQVPGGQSTSRTINVRLTELTSSGLFGVAGGTLPLDSENQRALPTVSSPILSTPVYVLDLNVFFDVIRERTHADDARAILARSLDGRLKLAVTSEFSEELRRRRGDFEGRRILPSQLQRGCPLARKPL